MRAESSLVTGERRCEGEMGQISHSVLQSTNSFAQARYSFLPIIAEPGSFPAPRAISEVYREAREEFHTPAPDSTHAQQSSAS